VSPTLSCEPCALRRTPSTTVVDELGLSSGLDDP
jgi:hypothetical protein